MIIDNTYFKGEVYIPHAKPSVTDSVLEVEGDILEFIEEYSRECLVQCFGPELFLEFEGNLDSTQANGIKLNADIKWDHLLNGLEYIDNEGHAVKWRGIRYKYSPEGYYRSFIANYVYFYYEKHDHITRSDVGHVQENAKNAWNVPPTEKVVRAWNKFVDQVQGRELTPRLVLNHGFVGVDFMYQKDHWHTSLYKFVEDTNTLNPGTYAEFKPREWKRINTYGI